MSEFELYSYDVFDTLVTRKVAKPDGIFVLMQNIISKDEKFKDLPQDVKENFYNYRKNSEHYQRRIKLSLRDYSEITLDTIYGHIKNTFLLTDEQIQRLKQLEIETELNNTVGISSNIKKIKKLINSGKRVVLISDMYLPKSILEQILANIDPELCKIKLYLSSEIGCMKLQGELYKYVKEQENVEYENWCHTGDAIASDIFPASALGIKTNHFKYPALTAYEKQLLEAQYCNANIQLLIGLSRNIRLNKFSDNEKAQLGASLTANILYPYVSWVLDQAQIKGIKHLFFIARDGYITQKMADVIIKIKNLDITTSYLYGSKKAWRNAGLDINDEKIRRAYARTLSWNNTKLDTICELDEETIHKILPQEFKDFSKKFDEETELKFYDYLLNNDELLKETVKHGAQKRENAINYLKQEYEKIHTDNFAFVEYDGSGLTNSCMGNLFRTFIDKKFDAYYLASTLGSFESNSIDFHYFYSVRQSLYGHILEIITRAPHGQTLGYKCKNGEWVPVLEEINTKTFEDWGFENYLKGILEFTKQYAENEQLKYPTDQTIMGRYIKFLTEECDKKTAELLGNTVNQLYGSESKTEFAPKISFIDSLIFFITGKIKTENVTYSALRSSSLVRRILKKKQKKLMLEKKKLADITKANRIRLLIDERKN